MNQPSSPPRPLSRRTFVKSAVVAAAASTTFNVPTILRAEDKADSKKLIVGDGAHKYEVIDDWAKRPENEAFGNTHMVQEVADGRIFVHHTGPKSIHVYDPDGKFITAFGEQWAGAAHGMDLRKEGGEEFLYLAPTGKHKVYKINLKGEVVFELPYPKDAKDRNGNLCYQDEKPYVPTFTAFAPGDAANDFYVTDGYGAGFIHRYNGKGEYQSTFGGKGNADDQTACPHGIYCDTRDPAKPLLVVADREHNRLQYFTLDGKLDHLVTNAPGSRPDEGMLRRPCHFDVRGDYLLIPDLRGRVTILDKDNKLVTQLGDNPNAAQRANNGVKKPELQPGIFCTPHGACFDAKGNIYVAEWLPYGRVTKLRNVG